MVITVMKMSFKKHSPIERHYRDYKYFDQTKFKNNLNEKLSEGISNYELFVFDHPVKLALKGLMFMVIE